MFTLHTMNTYHLAKLCQNRPSGVGGVLFWFSRWQPSSWIFKISNFSSHWLEVSYQILPKSSNGFGNIALNTF